MFDYVIPVTQPLPTISMQIIRSIPKLKLTSHVGFPANEHHKAKAPKEDLASEVKCSIMRSQCAKEEYTLQSYYAVVPKHMLVNNSVVE